MNKVGLGKVVLLSGGNKIYTDIAARFCHSNKSLDDIVGSPYDKDIVKSILDSGHNAATEFDYFIFGIEGYARVTEVQLVRKRLASYLIGSGRDNRDGKRPYNVVLPECIMDIDLKLEYPVDKITVQGKSLSELTTCDYVTIDFNTIHVLNILEKWYDSGVKQGKPEEDLRYLKPQGTEFKAIIGMNCHSLLDWFKIRCCKNAQTEIRDLAWKMLALCKNVSPDLFASAGPNCRCLGYCPEGNRQHQDCKTITKQKALDILKEYAENKD